MTIRTDITVLQELDPRIADVGASSESVSVQDSHDTLATIQDSYPGSQYPNLVSTAGKEDLGGGVLVGLTQSLLNVQYAPGSTSPRSSGTASATDGTGVTLTDGAADFVADGVVRGDWVINFTDQSVSEVLTVTTTAITTRGLRNGTANSFTSGDAYKVWEVKEFVLEGGNFVAADSANTAINPAFTTFGRFITRTSSSSATLQEQADLEYSSFNGGVTIDVVSGTSGTAFPTGTPRQPVDNVADAMTIASARGFTKLYVIGDLTLTTGDDVSEMMIVGQSPVLSTITIDAAATATNAQYEDAVITGTLDAGATIKNCHTTTLTIIEGALHDVLLLGTITLAGSNQLDFINCWSGVAGAATPEIDLGGSGQPLTMRHYSGGIKLSNHSGMDPISIDLNSGQVVLNSDLTAGTIIIRGTGKVVDTAGDPVYSGNFNGATIVNEMSTPDTIVNTLKNETFDGESFESLLTKLKSFGYGSFIETSEGVVDFYDDAGTTVLFTLTRAEVGGLTTRTVS